MTCIAGLQSRVLRSKVPKHVFRLWGLKTSCGNECHPVSRALDDDPVRRTSHPDTLAPQPHVRLSMPDTCSCCRTSSSGAWPLPAEFVRKIVASPNMHWSLFTRYGPVLRGQRLHGVDLQDDADIRMLMNVEAPCIRLHPVHPRRTQESQRLVVLPLELRAVLVLVRGLRQPRTWCTVGIRPRR